MPRVHTLNLYDKAFQFCQIKWHQTAEHEMYTLKMFEDNLNSNYDNGHHVESFIKNAKAI